MRGQENGDVSTYPGLEVVLAHPPPMAVMVKGDVCREKMLLVNICWTGAAKDRRVPGASPASPSFLRTGLRKRMGWDS